MSGGHVPSKTEKQRKFFGAELARRRAGRKTRMTEEQLEDYAKREKRKSRR